MAKRGLTRIAAAAALAAIAATAAVPATTTDAGRATPYWASLGAGQANMRTGPGRNYPTTWLYQRAGLPVKVIEVYPSWRKVEDPEGVQGWMLSNLLSDQRTALTVNGVHMLRAEPAAEAKPLWRIEPGVVGRIIKCGDGWCQIDVKGRAGYMPSSALWGISADEK